jgi:hypothetical protein
MKNALCNLDAKQRGYFRLKVSSPNPRHLANEDRLPKILGVVNLRGEPVGHEHIPITYSENLPRGMVFAPSFPNSVA